MKSWKPKKENKEKKSGQITARLTMSAFPMWGPTTTTPQVCCDERHARFQFEKDGGNTVVELAGSTMATFPYGVVLGLGNA